MSHLMNTYARLPIAFSHGDGSWVTDTDGISRSAALKKPVR